MSEVNIDNGPSVEPRRRAPRWLQGLAGVAAASTALSGCAVKGETVYFEPRAITDVDVTPAHEIITDDWAAGNCSPAEADDFTFSNVDTLAGFSLGRLGLAYFLEVASAERKAQVRHIIYYDPASKEDYTTNACDQRTPTQSAQLASWLSSNPNNHVTIINGWYAVDAAHPTADGKTDAGVRMMLLPNISGTALAGQVKLCTNSSLDHRTVLENHKNVMNQAWSPACPAGTTAQTI